jgi:hypothetical protein
MWKAILAWLLAMASLEIHTSAIPEGRRLGGADLPGVTDAYIVLHVSLKGIFVFSGYWQTA